jgi:1-acyl-sn-glycerol-3-phosphate acyltransferase
MQYLRSLLFTVLFYALSLLFSAFLIVTSIVPMSLERRFAIGPRAWGASNLWLLKAICGLGYTVEGRENLPDEPFIAMWKHSSTWETLAMMVVTPPAAWIQKKEVLWIPLLGWATLVYKPITIDRKAGHSSVNQVVTQGQERFEEGLGVLIYPEGTRVLPGQTRKFGISGALLATKTGRYAVPITHNAGYFWRRRGLLKHPGTIRVVIGSPIDPAGLEPREVNEHAQQWIESTLAAITAQPGGKPE